MARCARSSIQGLNVRVECVGCLVAGTAASRQFRKGPAAQPRHQVAACSRRQYRKRLECFQLQAHRHQAPHAEDRAAEDDQPHDERFKSGHVT